MTALDERYSKTEENIRTMNNTGNQNFEPFGSEKSSDSTDEGKLLLAPKCESSSAVIRPRSGYWQVYSLLEAGTLQRWGFITIDPNVHYQPDYTGILALINKCGHRIGTTLAEPVVNQFHLQMRDLKHKLFQCLEDEIKFVILIVPARQTRRQGCHYKVKEQSERELGILTHYIKERIALRRISPQTYTIVLKVDI